MSLPCQNMQPQLLICNYLCDRLVKPTGFIFPLQLAVSLTGTLRLSAYRMILQSHRLAQIITSWMSANYHALSL